MHPYQHIPTPDANLDQQIVNKENDNFEVHMSLEQAARLQIGDHVDHRYV